MRDAEWFHKQSLNYLRRFKWIINVTSVTVKAIQNVILLRILCTLKGLLIFIISIFKQCAPRGGGRFAPKNRHSTEGKKPKDLQQQRAQTSKNKKIRKGRERQDSTF
jgi:hypothetical protein